jgi:hypothetical protein
MVARDLTSTQATTPVPYKKNPDHDKDDPGSPEYVPAEPHIGLSGVNDEQKAPTYQTGVTRGGTSNPPKGETGKPVRLVQKPGDADPLAKPLGGDFGAFDSGTEDRPTVHQKHLVDEVGDVDKDAEIGKLREKQAKAAAKDADADAPVTTGPNA